MGLPLANLLRLVSDALPENSSLPTITCKSKYNIVEESTSFIFLAMSSGLTSLTILSTTHQRLAELADTKGTLSIKYESSSQGNAPSELASYLMESSGDKRSCNT